MLTKIRINGESISARTNANNTWEKKNENKRRRDNHRKSSEHKVEFTKAIRDQIGLGRHELGEPLLHDGAEQSRIRETASR